MMKKILSLLLFVILLCNLAYAFKEYEVETESYKIKIKEDEFEYEIKDGTPLFQVISDTSIHWPQPYEWGSLEAGVKYFNSYFEITVYGNYICFEKDVYYENKDTLLESKFYPHCQYVVPQYEQVPINDTDSAIIDVTNITKIDKYNVRLNHVKNLDPLESNLSLRSYCWDFDNLNFTDEVSGLNMANSGVSIETSLYMTGNGSAYFDGSAYLLNASGLSAFPAITVLAWVHPNTTTIDHGIFGSQTGGDSELIWLDTNGGVLRNGLLLTSAEYGDQTIPNASWSLVGFTDDTNNWWSIYNDDIDNNSNFNAWQSTSNVFIGGSSTTGKLMNGYIDTLVVFPRVLSPTEISDYYNNSPTCDEMRDSPSACSPSYSYTEWAGPLCLQNNTITQNRTKVDDNGCEANVTEYRDSPCCYQLNTPTGFGNASHNNESIYLTWELHQNAEKYLIYNFVVNYWNTTAITYNVTDLTANTLYCLNITAYNSSCVIPESNQTSPVCVYTAENEVPATPYLNKLVLNITFDGSDLTNIIDHSEYGNNGWCNRSDFVDDGIVSKGMKFYGWGTGTSNHSYCRIPSHNMLTNMSNFTIMMWLKPNMTYTEDGTDEHKFYAIYQPIEKVLPFGYHTWSGGEIEASIWNYSESASRSYTRGDDITSLSADTWYHLASTYNSSHLCLYIGGIEKSCVSANNYIFSDSIYDFFIGGKDQTDANQNYTFNGTIDEVLVYNYPLTPTQIFNQMNSTNNSDVPCVTLWSNTTPTSWVNTGLCNISNLLTQNRSYVTYDANGCNTTNTTHWEYQDIACNYCSYSLNYTEWGNYTNTTCGTRTRYFWDINYQSCCNTTGIAEDCYDLDNSTYWRTYNESESISCDNIIGAGINNENYFWIWFVSFALIYIFIIKYMNMSWVGSILMLANSIVGVVILDSPIVTLNIYISVLYCIYESFKLVYYSINTSR